MILAFNHLREMKMKNYNLKSGKPISNNKHYDWKSEIEPEIETQIREDVDYTVDEFEFMYGELPLIRVDRFNDKMIQIKNRMN